MANIRQTKNEAAAGPQGFDNTSESNPWIHRVLEHVCTDHAIKEFTSKRRSNLYIPIVNTTNDYSIQHFLRNGCRVRGKFDSHYAPPPHIPNSSADRASRATNIQYRAVPASYTANDLRARPRVSRRLLRRTKIDHGESYPKSSW